MTDDLTKLSPEELMDAGDVEYQDVCACRVHRAHSEIHRRLKEHETFSRQRDKVHSARVARGRMIS